MAVRMFADAAILQLALVSALAVRLFVWVAFQDNSAELDAGDMFRNYLSVYCNTAWPPKTSAGYWVSVSGKSRRSA